MLPAFCRSERGYVAWVVRSWTHGSFYSCPRLINRASVAFARADDHAGGMQGGFFGVIGARAQRWQLPWLQAEVRVTDGSRDRVPRHLLDLRVFLKSVGSDKIKATVTIHIKVAFRLANSQRVCIIIAAVQIFAAIFQPN